MASIAAGARACFAAVPWHSNLQSRGDQGQQPLPLSFLGNRSGIPGKAGARVLEGNGTASSFLAPLAGNPARLCERRRGAGKAQGTEFAVEKETGNIVCVPKCVKERE